MAQYRGGSATASDRPPSPSAQIAPEHRSPSPLEGGPSPPQDTISPPPASHRSWPRSFYAHLRNATPPQAPAARSDTHTCSPSSTSTRGMPQAEQKSVQSDPWPAQTQAPSPPAKASPHDDPAPPAAGLPS